MADKKKPDFRTILGQVKSIDTAAHTVDFVINSGGMDLMQEELVPMGCDYDDFMRNPVVLWAHDDWSPPIAKALNVRPDPEEGVLSTAQFAVDLDPFAARIFKLYEHEYLHGVSVRFIPIETTSFDVDSPERQATGLRRRYEKWKLLEYSPVPIPCDPNALALGLDRMRETKGLGARGRLSRENFMSEADDTVALATLMVKRLEREGVLESVLAGSEPPTEPVIKTAGFSPGLPEQSALLDPEMDAALAGVLKMAREHLWALNR